MRKSMADIKNYEVEKNKIEKRKRGEPEYKKKIKQYRRAIWNRMMLVFLVLAVVIGIVSYQYYNHIYVEYEVISDMDREATASSRILSFHSGVLGYSNDGAYYKNEKGDLTWNISYVMQNPMVEIEGTVAAISDYDGQSIYLLDENEQIGEINTNMPIKRICISATGIVAAVLEDKEISWIYLYDTKGNVLAQSRTTMPDFGYPISLNISPDGVMLMVSFLYVDQGEIKTTIAFFNFDEVGQSQLDNLVSGYNYADTIMPILCFMDQETSYAVGDDRIVFFKGKNKPELLASHLFDGEVQSVYHNEDYVGIVFLNNQGSSRYRFIVYDKEGNKVSEKEFDLEYTDIFFEHKNYVIYNEKNCLINTVDGRLKYDGVFEQTVQLMYPTAKTYEYNLVTADSYYVIALK